MKTTIFIIAAACIAIAMGASAETSGAYGYLGTPAGEFTSVVSAYRD